MLVIAHAIAITCYIAAAGLAAAPFARPIAAPVRGVIDLLSAGGAVHLVALSASTWQFCEPPRAWRRSARAQVAAVRRNLPVFSSARDARPRESSRDRVRMDRAHPGDGARRWLLARLP